MSAESYGGWTYPFGAKISAVTHYFPSPYANSFCGKWKASQRMGSWLGGVRPRCKTCVKRGAPTEINEEGI
jgi:hypothetical protein